MGGTSTTQQKTSQQTEPWGPAQDTLKGILSQLNSQIPNSGLTSAETGAINSIEGNASNPFAGQIGGVAGNLLGGGGANAQAPMLNQNYQNFQNSLQPFASGQYVDPASNPQLQKYLGVIQNDVSNNVNSMFAGAGRDLSGIHQQSLARGIAQGEAPVLADAYNTARGQQLGAMGDIYNAGNTTGGILSGLNQTGLANQQAGIEASQNALGAQNYGANLTLAAEAQRRGIPISALGGLTGIAAPIAGLGGSSTGTMTGSQTLSPAQQAWGWMNSFGNLNRSFGY